MPNVGEICGIVFFIFSEMGAPHHLPHVTVKYGNYKANYDIENGRRLVGSSFPVAQERLIRRVLRNHKKELMECWNKLNQEDPQPCGKIFFRA